jgi:hypothetical protein
MLITVRLCTPSKLLAGICRASRQSGLAYRSCAYSVSGVAYATFASSSVVGEVPTQRSFDHDPIILSDQMIEYVKSKCYRMIALALDV